MKIGIDTQIVSGQKTGFGFYTANLISNLKKLKSNLDFEFIEPDSNNDLSIPKRIQWDQFGFPKKAKRKKVDLIHQTAFSVPIFTKIKSITTVHDLIAVEQGSDIPFWSRNYFGRFVPFTYKFADHLIAVSEHTKKDIIRLLKIREDKITVIYEAADEKFKPINNSNEIDRVKSKYQTGDNFILHVGTISPRKNIEFLIKTFSRIATKLPDFQLVIAGKEGWYAEQIVSLAKDLEIDKRISFIGYIDEEDKVAIYNAAKLLAYPSLYEGFGLPPLEAMACGLPVIASNVSSIPEVVGGAGILLSPKDEDGWVREIISLLNDKDKSTKYSNLGLEQAKKFSWEKTARETIQVYQKVLDKN